MSATRRKVSLIHESTVDVEIQVFGGINVRGFNPIEIFVKMLSRRFGQKCLLFRHSEKLSRYSWEPRKFSPANLSTFTVYYVINLIIVIIISHQWIRTIKIDLRILFYPAFALPCQIFQRGSNHWHQFVGNVPVDIARIYHRISACSVKLVAKVSLL